MAAKKAAPDVPDEESPPSQEVGLYALGNPTDRVYAAGEVPPPKRTNPTPDGSRPGFVGRRPGDDAHTPHPSAKKG